DDVVSQSLLERERFFRLLDCLSLSEVRGEGRDWIRSPIEQQVFAQAPLLGRERRVALELLRVHDRHVQTGLNTVIEEDGVEDLATGGRQPERHVGNAQDRLALGEA